MTDDSNPLAGPDVAFLIAQRKELLLPEAMRSQWLADALAHHIARRPVDLRRHVQRVLLHQAQQQGDALFAALLDLFIALGRSGHALRDRLARESLPLLNEAQQNFLMLHVAIGVIATDVHPVAPRSKLSVGASGSFDFITRIQKSSQDTRSPLEQALDFITYGQLNEAQQVLEQALIENPRDKDVCLELAQLFEHTRDADAVRQILDKLGDSAPARLQQVAHMLEVEPT